MSKNAFKDYLIEMAKYPLLTAEEELELGRRIKDEGDMEARERFIASNLRLVVKVAKSYRNQYFDIDELVSEGTIGLITAVDKYDYTLGYRFSTSAVNWIMQAICKALTDKGRSIRLPSHIYKQISDMRKFVDSYLETHDEEPSDEQIAEALKTTAEKVHALKQWKIDTISMDTPLNDEEKNNIGDLIADDGESPTDYTERILRSEQIQEVLTLLQPRTQTIMKMRYGLGGPNDPADWANEHTLEQIGEYLGITRERVRQVEKETLQYLKINWENLI